MSALQLCFSTSRVFFLFLEQQTLFKAWNITFAQKTTGKTSANFICGVFWQLDCCLCEQSSSSSFLLCLTLRVNEWACFGAEREAV